MSSVSPCFLKMPARWPTSDTDVSQLPRWPIASLTVSCADAASPSSANASAQAMVFAFITLPPGILYFDAVSGHAFARLLAPAAERTPVDGLGYYTFVGAYRRMRHAIRGADRRAAALHRARGFHHQAAERDDRHVGCADTLAGAVADRSHAFPHRDVLIGNARNAGEVAVLHRGTVLQVVVRARADAVEVRVDIDAPFEHVELAPRVHADAGFVGAVPCDEVEDRGVIVFRRQQGRDIV